MDALPCIYDGEGFRPTTPFHARRAAEAFGAGEIVMFSAEAERDWIAHKKQFAVIRTAWMNLPEAVQSEDYAKSAETLRKRALIATGYADCETVVTGSKAAAERVGAYVGSLARKAHGYCIVQVEGPAVRCWTPHSQSAQAMGADTFRRSKSDITAWCADLLGVSVGELEGMGRRDAA